MENGGKRSKTKYLDKQPIQEHQLYQNHHRVRLPEGAGAQRECQVESAMGDKLKQLGCLYWKFVSPGTNGVADRIVILPNGVIYFVEMKRLGEVERDKQVYRREQLLSHKVRHRFVHGSAEADEFVEEVRHAIRAT